MIYMPVVFMKKWASQEDGFIRRNSANAALESFDSLVDVIFWIDLILTFFTGYVNEWGRIETEMPDVASNYVKGYFWFDLFGVMPYQTFMGEGHVEYVG